MRRIIVDSGSSIKEDEKARYGVEILPFPLQMGNESFWDGVELDTAEFYRKLKNRNQFPKTSLPSLGMAQELVDFYTAQGDEVLIITLSSGISGTYQALKMLFAEYPKAEVFDSKLAVGGIRLLVKEAKRHEHEPMNVVIEKLTALRSRIVIAAIPETLDYLLAGGRLSRNSWMVGTLFSITPIITFIDGKVSVLSKKRGIRQGKRALVELLEKYRPDKAHGIIAAYTYNKENVDDMLQMLSDEHKAMVSVYDDLCSSIACHWGPNAFDIVYVKEA